MAWSCDEIGQLVVRIQREFLENPGLQLTLDEARKRFELDVTVCEAILAALIDARVLAIGTAGTFLRRFPLGDQGGTPLQRTTHRSTTSASAAA